MQIAVESTMEIIEWQDVGGMHVKFGVGVVVLIKWGWRGVGGFVLGMDED